MQKISTYLYPNRIQLLANLASFNVEFTNVYQRPIKIYKGVDNVVEFDIKNSDQKRIELLTSPEITNIKLNVMDASGLSVGQYDVTPDGVLKGIATATIPSNDLDALDNQFLKYSITCDKGISEIVLYGDTRFSAIGTLELVGTVKPVTRDPVVYDTFTAEIDLQGIPVNHSSAIPATFYEAIKTTELNFAIDVVGFTGSVWLDATTNPTLNVEAWNKAGRPFGSWVRTVEDGPFTGTISFGSNIPVGDYKYFRVSYRTPSFYGNGAVFEVTRAGGNYTVTVIKGGTQYGVGSVIKVLGSQLGGTDGVNDLMITVTSLGDTGTTSSYTVSALHDVVWEGTAAAGTGTYNVSGINYSGKVDKVTVS